MRFETLLQHVQRAEQRVELRATHAQLQWATLKQAWRDGWTPGRIVIAGLVSGFLATAQAAAAAETAEQAADTAQEAQEQADVQTDEEPLVDEAFDEDEIVVTAPRPAEAATELSER